MGFLTWLGTLIVEWLLNKVWPIITGAISGFFANLKRTEDQKNAKQKVDDDINNKAPRDDKTKDDENKWINS